MKQLFGILLLMLVLAGCKKDKVPATEPVPASTKWELISGHYKVYDTTGLFIYEMNIEHHAGFNEFGYVDSLCFENFDGNFNISTIQSKASPYPLNVTIGSYTELHDTVDNRWDIFGFSSDGFYNTYRNDTIIFYFQKQNMPYWWNDGTQYFNENLKHIAVKQH